MAKMVKKSFDASEETRSLHKGKIEAVDLGGVKVTRVIHDVSSKIICEYEAVAVN